MLVHKNIILAIYIMTTPTPPSPTTVKWPGEDPAFWENRALPVDIPKECIRRKTNDDVSFSDFASKWAKEEREDRLKQEYLDNLEDIMENVMQLADSVVKMTSKVKKELRNKRY